MKKEVSDYLDWWLLTELGDITHQMSKSYNLNKRLLEEFGVTTREVFENWDSELLKTLGGLMESNTDINLYLK